MTEKVEVREMISDIIISPFIDLKRFVVGSVSQAPPTRDVSAEGLATARGVLAEAGCVLAHCTVDNLHTGITAMPLEQLFELVASWQMWPRSSVHACPRRDDKGDLWFSYRFYGQVPVVVMKLRTTLKPRYIIYDLISGIGAGGYHAFLFDHNEEGMSVFSILSTFAPTPWFFEGLHDQFNIDIYRHIQKLHDEQDKP